MSRNQIAERKAGRKPLPARRNYSDYTDEERAARLEFSEIPEHLGETGAAARIREMWGIEISPATCQRDTANGRLTMHLVAGRRRYSDRSLYEYVVLNSNTSAARKGA